ncbi:hypothetical protein [Methylobacterium indicum]|uniref:Uncharacterized protein n=1 Tax=Methylobacterium indicum TaxID=1775910 RepID=A0A8H8X1I8_9HYPH|nr:hypothetical protein [Methylobacterium indicum]BCM87969.1 hypothetical protein mvi_64300 [Methylobacterium indicum]
MPAGPAYLWQVTLNTGDGRHSLRTDVTEQALVVARPLLDLVAEQPVAGLGLVRSEQYGSATILRVRDEAGPRCAIGVALRSRGAAQVWQALHDEGIAALATVPDSPPAAPWCGLVLADRMRDRPRPETMELVVLARVIGWAVVEQAT